MRYGIFSDVHSNLEALTAVIDAYKKEKIDLYLCAGDIVGYAANPKECINKVDALAMATVAGNHDLASVGLFSVTRLNSLAKDAILWTREVLGYSERYFLESLKPVYQNVDLTLVHGTLNHPEDFNYMTDIYLAKETFDILNTDLCFIGHTHIPGVFIRDIKGNIEYKEEMSLNIIEGNKYIVNVGSVGQPRDRNPMAAFCIYDTEKKQVWIKRIGYNIEAAVNKIIRAGLPRFLADRLFVGR